MKNTSKNKFIFKQLKTESDLFKIKMDMFSQDTLLYTLLNAFAKEHQQYLDMREKMPDDVPKISGVKIDNDNLKEIIEIYKNLLMVTKNMHRTIEGLITKSKQIHNDLLLKGQRISSINNTNKRENTHIKKYTKNLKVIAKRISILKITNGYRNNIRMILKSLLRTYNNNNNSLTIGDVVGFIEVIQYENSVQENILNNLPIETR